MGEGMFLVMLMNPSARFSLFLYWQSHDSLLFLWGQTQLQTTDDAD